MKYTKREVDRKRVKEVSEHFKIPPLAATILQRRGVDQPRDLLYFLERDLRFLHNPFLLQDMTPVVERLREARENREIIGIYGDKDVDGVTSTVLLIEGLQRWGFEPVWEVPTGEENYGLSQESVRRFAEEGCSLLMTVDCGISKFEEVTLADSLGLDVIVLDHHKPHPTKLPQPALIVNPKREDSPYPFTDLAGCAVVNKLLWALLFSDSELYESHFTLLHLEKRGETFHLSGETLQNFCSEESLELTYNPQEQPLEAIYDPFQNFAQEKTLLVFDKAEQTPLFRELFPSVEVQLTSFRSLTEEKMPALKGDSLSQIAQKSRLARYLNPDYSLSEVQRELFILSLLQHHQKSFEPYQKTLDLTMFGTVADMMPLQNENRILVHQGFLQVQRGTRPAIKELLHQLNIHVEELTLKKISWELLPVINSAGRLGRGDLPIRLFLERDPRQRESLIQELIAVNKERKNLVEKLFRRSKTPAEQSYYQSEKRGIMIRNDEIPRGVTGLLANRIARQFRVPALIITKREEVISGSIRCDSPTFIAQFFSRFEESFLDFGGHENAGGFSVTGEKFLQIEEKVISFLSHWQEPTPDPQTEDQTKKKQTKKETTKPREREPLDIDATIPVNFPLDKILEARKSLEPYGKDFPPLLFELEEAEVTKVEPIGNESQHLRVHIRSGEFTYPCLYWNGLPHFKESFDENERVRVAIHIEYNYYRGLSRPQFEISLLERERES